MYGSYKEYGFSEGDKIVYTSHPRRPQGIIYSIDRINDTVEIEWSEDLVPKKQTFTLDFMLSDHVRITRSLPFGINNKCTCGVDSVGEGLHSDYCSKYEKR